MRKSAPAYIKVATEIFALHYENFFANNPEERMKGSDLPFSGGRNHSGI